MVKTSELIVVRYCDHCNEKKTRATYTCSICESDLCDFHRYGLALPPLKSTNGKDRPPVESICPGCAEEPLGKLAVNLMRITSKSYEQNPLRKTGA